MNSKTSKFSGKKKNSKEVKEKFPVIHHSHLQCNYTQIQSLKNETEKCSTPGKFVEKYVKYSMSVSLTIQVLKSSLFRQTYSVAAHVFSKGRH